MPLDLTSPLAVSLIAVTLTSLVVSLYVVRSRRQAEADEARRREIIRARNLKEKALKEADDAKDDGKTKVLVFFGSQTGTAEGCAKSIVDKARKVPASLLWAHC